MRCAQQERSGRSVTYHYRPLLERLEQRRLLTSIIGQDPLPNTHDAPVTTDVSAVFDADINPATVSAQTFAVHGMQTGQILESFSVSGDTGTFSPDTPFHPGELVQATATGGIEDLRGEALAAPFVWQFRTAASGGTGFFNDSGQSPGGLVALGDLDGDGDLDVFDGHWGANTVRLNDGSGNFTDSGQRLGDSLSSAVALGDFDGDGDLDAFVSNYPSVFGATESNKVWVNDGNGSFSDSGQRLGDSDSHAVALGDLDGDADLDAFVGNYSGNKVWLNDGSGSFVDSRQSLGASPSLAMALGDLDGDGDLDALDGDVVWLNDGNGTFVQSSFGPTGRAVALGDLDGDGDLDAFVGSGANTVWLNWDPTPGDFDNDQDVDGDDFLIWQTGFGIQSGATRYDGDADFDGDVDGDDFLIWQANLGNGEAAGGASAVATARSGNSDRLGSSTLREGAVEETFAERGRALARWTKRSVRDELLDELTLLK